MTGAPFLSERRLIFDALNVWLTQTGAMLPGARCWIDGGFVTHKPWAAPTDVDVVVLVRGADLSALSTQDQITFENNLTRADGISARYQPMGGYVDAYYALRENPADAPYWHGFWGNVKLSDGSMSNNERKGYVEVIL